MKHTPTPVPDKTLKKEARHARENFRRAARLKGKQKKGGVLTEKELAMIKQHEYLRKTANIATKKSGNGRLTNKDGRVGSILEDTAAEPVPTVLLR